MRGHNKTNRILLALLGLVFLSGSLLTLAGGSDIYRHWDLTPPAGWPLTGSEDTLIPRADQTQWSTQGWWWPAVIATLALFILLVLGWLWSQVRRRRSRRLSLGHTPRKAATVNDHGLRDALTTDLDTLPGIKRAHAHFHGPRHHPRAQISLTLDSDSTPQHVLDGVSAAVERARNSAGWDELPTLIRLRVTRHGPHRAE